MRSLSREKRVRRPSGGGSGGFLKSLWRWTTAILTGVFWFSITTFCGLSIVLSGWSCVTACRPWLALESIDQTANQPDPLLAAVVVLVFGAAGCGSLWELWGALRFRKSSSGDFGP